MVQRLGPSRCRRLRAVDEMSRSLLEYHPSLLLDLSAFLPGPSMVQGVCGKPLLIPKCQRCAEEADSRDEVERGWGPRARQ